MAHQQAVDYVKERKAGGATEAEIVGELRKNGWQERDIAEALAASAGGVPPAPAPTGAELPGAGALMSEAWALVTGRAHTLLAITLVPLLAGAVMVGGVIAFGSFAAQITGAVGVIVPFVLGLILLIAAAVIGVWSQAALLFAVKDSGEGIGFGESYRRSRSLLGSYFWVSLLTGFITMGGLILFVIPGIIFMGWFSLSLYVFASENVRGMDALLKSKEYVRGNWGGVFWRLLALILFSLLASLAASLIFGLFPYGKQVAQGVVSLFLTPFSMAYLFSLYRHLRAKKGEVAAPSGGGQKTAFIVIGIVGMLILPLIFSVVVFFNLNGAAEKARDAQRETDLRLQGQLVSPHE